VIDPAIHTLLCSALALLFLAAALHKLRDLHAFRVALGDYQLVPWILTGPAAPALAIAELGVSGALLLPAVAPQAAAALPAPGSFAGRVGCLGAAGLLALYSAAIAWNLLRGRRDIDCGCFGPALRTELGPGLLIRNGVLLAAAAAGLLPVAPRMLGAGDALSVAGGLAFLAVAHAATSRLLAQAPPLGAGR